MPVKLRLRRQGRKKAPHYSIVAADSRAPRDGRYIEKIGFYNPVANPAHIFVDHELALKWLSVGAQPTHTVRSILRHAGVNLKFALIKQGKNEDEMERIFNSWWEMKKARKKKKFVQVDVHGKPLEDIPVVELAEHSSTAEPESATAETEPEASVEEEAVDAAEATATENTPAPEAEAALAEEAALVENEASDDNEKTEDEEATKA